MKIDTLLVNETQARKFLQTVLPTLENDEVFIFLIFARKKYNPAVKDEWLLYRDILKSNDIEENMRKIKRASLVYDYVDFKTGENIPLDAFVFYIDLNPKSMRKGYNAFAKQMNDLMYQATIRPEKSKDFIRMKKYFYSSIHTSNSRKPYVVLDIDQKDELLLKKIINNVDTSEIKWLSETRGGYHIIFNKTGAINKQLWSMKEKFDKWDVEIKAKNPMTVLVGTLQGGFETKQYNR